MESRSKGGRICDIRGCRGSPFPSIFIMAEVVWQPPQYALDKAPFMKHVVRIPEDVEQPQNFARSARLYATILGRLVC